MDSIPYRQDLGLVHGRDASAAPAAIDEAILAHENILTQEAFETYLNLGIGATDVIADGNILPVTSGAVYSAIQTLSATTEAGAPIPVSGTYTRSVQPNTRDLFTATDVDTTVILAFPSTAVSGDKYTATIVSTEHRVSIRLSSASPEAFTEYCIYGPLPEGKQAIHVEAEAIHGRWHIHASGADYPVAEEYPCSIRT